MVKKEKDRQTILHKTQHRKLKTEQEEPHQTTRSDLWCLRKIKHADPL